MTNFDFYRNNPAAAAALIAREGHCFLCPMCEQCTHEDYYICFVMWMRFFKINTEPLRIYFRLRLIVINVGLQKKMNVIVSPYKIAH